MTDSWLAARHIATENIEQGKPVDALNVLMPYLKGDQEAIRLACQIASESGRHEFLRQPILEVVDSISEELNVETLVHCLDILRRNGEFDAFFEGFQTLIGMEPEQSKSALWFLSEAVLDQALLESAVDADVAGLMSFCINQPEQVDGIDEHIFFGKLAEKVNWSPAHSKMFLAQIRIATAKGLVTFNTPRVQLLFGLLIGELSSITSGGFIAALEKADTAQLARCIAFNETARCQFLVAILKAKKEMSSWVIPPSILLILAKLDAMQPDAAVQFLLEEALSNELPSEPSDRGYLDQLFFCYQDREYNGLARYAESTDLKDRLSTSPFWRVSDQLAAPEHFSATRKPKIAVAISGQLRGYKAAFSELKKTLLDNVDAQIFVDTWSNIGRKTPDQGQAWRVFEGPFLEAYLDALNSLGFEAMRNRYPNLTGLAGGNKVSHEDLCEFYKCEDKRARVEDDTSEPFTTWSNAQKMYYKISRVPELIERSGQEFDAVVRIRPDKSPKQLGRDFDWNDILSNSALKRVLYADYSTRAHPSVGFVIGDQFALAVPEIMQLYAKAAETSLHPTTSDWMDWPKSEQPHVNLSHALWVQGVSVRTAPIAWNPLRDPSTISSEEIRTYLIADQAQRPADRYDKALLSALENVQSQKVNLQPIEKVGVAHSDSDSILKRMWSKITEG